MRLYYWFIVMLHQTFGFGVKEMEAVILDRQEEARKRQPPPPPFVPLPMDQALQMQQRHMNAFASQQSQALRNLSDQQFNAMYGDQRQMDAFNLGLGMLGGIKWPR